MNFYTLNIGEREFDCRLGTREVVNLEKVLGTNPLNVLMGMSDNTLPETGILLIILHAAGKEDGKKLKMDDWYDLYDEFLAEGKSIADLLEIVMEIFEVSGLIPKEVEEQDDIKNVEGK